MTKTSSTTLEDTLSRLESLISKLDGEGVSLEDSLAAFEQGIKLAREAQTALRDAEQRVQLLMEKNGDVAVEPLQVENGE
jgi:exodeoxyribonuclease VII small subunit